MSFTCIALHCRYAAYSEEELSVAPGHREQAGSMTVSGVTGINAGVNGVYQATGQDYNGKQLYCNPATGLWMRFVTVRTHDRRLSISGPVKIFTECKTMKVVHPFIPGLAHLMCCCSSLPSLCPLVCITLSVTSTHPPIHTCSTRTRIGG